MIKISGLGLKFKDKTIFENFSLRIAEGETVVLRAPSGKGKTSLAYMIMGFLRPDSGKIEIGGEELNGATVHAIRRRICYIGQDASMPGGTAREIIDEVASFSINKHIDFSKERIKDLLEAFSLTEAVLDKQADTISGGERRRLAFVLCVLLGRDIWLLDEITAGLDDERKRQVIDHVVGCGKTVVVISHDDVWNEYENVRHISW